MRFWIVNVFVRPDREGRVPPQSGNPLAVVECPAGALDDAQMQAVAFEFGFSETTFVAPEADAGGAWATRIFTPTAELPFAGHPTLGTAHVVRTHLATESDAVTLSLPVGDVPVRLEDEGRGWLTAPPVKLCSQPEPQALAHAWGFDPALLDPKFPPATYQPGPVISVVPLRSPAAVEAFQVPTSGPDQLQVIAREPAGQVLRVRFFAPNEGVREDPATGGAACALGRYLLDHAYLGPGPEARVDLHQGQEVGRPSLLSVHAVRSEDGDTIEVGGQIREFARGELV